MMPPDAGAPRDRSDAVPKSGEGSGEGFERQRGRGLGRLGGDGGWRRREFRARRRRFHRSQTFSLNRLIPNILTLLALCAGMTAIRYALLERFEASVAAILVAAVFDGLDGRVARLLKSTSEFGAQLDSLSDFISFGVAPGVLAYLWTLEAVGSVGWAIALLYAVCCALRLARFNAELGLDKPVPYAHSFFTGVPAPAAAGLVLLPIMMSFEVGRIMRAPLLDGAVMVAISALMVSRVPTYSLKRFRLKPDQVVPVLLGVGLLAAFLTSAPWPTLSLIGLVYLASIPFSVRQMSRLKKAARRAAPAEDDATPVA